MKRLLLLPLLLMSSKCAPTPYQAKDTTVVDFPVDGDCESWRPLFDLVGLPYDKFQPIMWRESRCTNVHTYSKRYRDDSYGPLQVNRWSTAKGWDNLGYTQEVMATPVGALQAAKVLYDRCGMGPWTKPYRCPGGWPL